MNSTNRFFSAQSKRMTGVCQKCSCSEMSESYIWMVECFTWSSLHFIAFLGSLLKLWWFGERSCFSCWLYGSVITDKMYVHKMAYCHDKQNYSFLLGVQDKEFSNFVTWLMSTILNSFLCNKFSSTFFWWALMLCDLFLLHYPCFAWTSMVNNLPPNNFSVGEEEHVFGCTSVPRCHLLL